MCIKLVIETSLYYDARSEEHKKTQPLVIVKDPATQLYCAVTTGR